MSIVTSERETIDFRSSSVFFSPVLMMVVFSSEFASSSLAASLSIITLQSPKSTASMSFCCYSASGSSSGLPSEIMTSFCFFKVSFMLDVRTLMFPSNFWISLSIKGCKPCPAGANGMGSNSCDSCCYCSAPGMQSVMDGERYPSVSCPVFVCAFFSSSSSFSTEAALIFPDFSVSLAPESADKNVSSSFVPSRSSSCSVPL